jgi:hypothetical protein
MVAPLGRAVAAPSCLRRQRRVRSRTSSGNSAGRVSCAGQASARSLSSSSQVLLIWGRQRQQRPQREREQRWRRALRVETATSGAQRRVWLRHRLRGPSASGGPPRDTGCGRGGSQKGPMRGLTGQRMLISTAAEAKAGLAPGQTQQDRARTTREGRSHLLHAAGSCAGLVPPVWSVLLRR